MRRLLWLMALAALVLGLLMPRSGSWPLPVYAEPLTDETKQLLEKGLSVTEIDREIERIAGLRAKADQDIADSKKRLNEQEMAIVVQREQAGRVLRSSYMGQKDAIWGALLNFHSFGELIRNLEVMDLIFQSDKDTMTRYTDSYKQLKGGYEKLRRDQEEMAKVEKDLRDQRERVASLQAEVERAIANGSNPELLRKQMNEMQLYWQNVGLYEVRRHFNALAQAMNKIPDWVKDHPDMLETKGLSATLTISDSQLNAFLQSEDELLKQFTIAFKPGKLTLSGTNGNMKVDIEGHYTVENEPKNAILFHLDTLVFNGLTLPDTTRNDLVRDFDLGFYPQDLIKLVKADSVSLEEGKLIVRLKLGK